jgi:hypothetical protein
VLCSLVATMFASQPVSACGITEGFATGTNTGQVLCSFIEPANQLQQDLRLRVFNKSQEGFLIGGGATNAIAASAWANVLVIANVLFAVLFLVIIYGVATNSNSVKMGYTIKKTLPRLVIGAVAINVSFYALLALVDLTSIIGTGITRLIIGNDSTVVVSTWDNQADCEANGLVWQSDQCVQQVYNSTVPTLTNRADCESHELIWRDNRCHIETDNMPPNPAIEGAALTLIVPSSNADQSIRRYLSDRDQNAADAMNSNSLAVGWLLTVALAIVNLSYIGLLMLFTFRQVAIIALAVISSIAFCSLILLGTKKFFWGWLDFLVRVVLIAPIAILVQTFVSFVVDAIPSGGLSGIGMVEIIAEATAAVLILAACLVFFAKSRNIIQRAGKVVAGLRENNISHSKSKDTSSTSQETKKRQSLEENRTRSNTFDYDKKTINDREVVSGGSKRVRSRRRLGSFNIERAALDIKNSVIRQQASDAGANGRADTRKLSIDGTSRPSVNNANATNNATNNLTESREANYISTGILNNAKNNSSTTNLNERARNQQLDNFMKKGDQMPSIVGGNNEQNLSKNRFDSQARYNSSIENLAENMSNYNQNNEENKISRQRDSHNLSNANNTTSNINTYTNTSNTNNISNASGNQTTRNIQNNQVEKQSARKDDVTDIQKRQLDRMRSVVNGATDQKTNKADQSQQAILAATDNASLSVIADMMSGKGSVSPEEDLSDTSDKQAVNEAIAPNRLSEEIRKRQDQSPDDDIMKE